MDDVCREPWPTLSSLSFVIRLNLSNSCPPLFVFSLLGFFLFFFFLMVFYLILILNSPVESAHVSLIALVVNVFELISHFFFFTFVGSFRKNCCDTSISKQFPLHSSDFALISKDN